MNRSIEDKTRDQKAWDRIASSEKFQGLLALKREFIIPAFVVFLAYHLLLFVLVGYAPAFMSTRVIGTVNLAFLFALSQFAVGWLIAWRYLKASAKFDRLTRDILEDDDGAKGMASRGES